MTTNNFCFYLQNRLIQTSKTGGQWYSDTSPFSILWFYTIEFYGRKKFYGIGLHEVISSLLSNQHQGQQYLKVKCLETFYRGNLLSFHCNIIILCYKAILPW